VRPELPRSFTNNDAANPGNSQRDELGLHVITKNNNKGQCKATLPKIGLHYTPLAISADGHTRNATLQRRHRHVACRR